MRTTVPSGVTSASVTGQSAGGYVPRATGSTDRSKSDNDKTPTRPTNEMMKGRIDVTCSSSPAGNRVTDPLADGREPGR